jgi:small-conductance mechanosensitive channel
MLLRLALTVALLSLALAAAPRTAGAQDAQTVSPPSTESGSGAPLSPAEAQSALELLQDDAKRSQLIDSLRALAAASAQRAPSESAGVAQDAVPVSRDGLGVQLLAEVSESVGALSHEVATAAQTITNFPLLWHWLVETVTDPHARDTLFSTAWRLAFVLAAALGAEWIMQRAVRRPRALLEKHVPGRARDRVPPNPEEQQAAEIAARRHADPELRSRSATFERLWRFLLRLPFVALGLLLDLLPVLAFTIVGNILLMSDLGSERTPRLVILAIVNAYVLCRVIMCGTRALISPRSQTLSMLTLRGETAAYIEIWVRRIVTLAVFGIALANVALLLGLYLQAYAAVVKLVMLVVHLLLVVVTLQCRQAVAKLIRAPEDARGIVATIRNRFADVWHYVAIFLNLAIWAIWALSIRNGYTLLLQYVLATVAVLVLARLASVVVLGSLDRLFRINPEFIRRFPGLETRANKYYPLLRRTLSALIVAIAVATLLQVWGIPAMEWLYMSDVGGRLMSALVTIGVVALAALAAWEASNAAIDRHLARLTREARYARAARLRTILPIVRTTLLCVILTIVGLTVLSELGVNIAPLLAGAGIIGIAIGFGSQKLVQDFITGLFLLFENAMQVGDVVTVSGLSGTVEHLSIRTIRLRAGDGSVHIIPFSAVTSVTNTNRGMGNASVSVSVAYHEDTDRVGEVLKGIARELRQDAHFKPLIRGDLELWGVDKVDGSKVTMIGQIPCTDSGRWPVQREFYRRMKQAFQERGIEIAPSAETIVMVQPQAAPLMIEGRERPRKVG